MDRILRWIVPRSSSSHIWVRCMVIPSVMVVCVCVCVCMYVCVCVHACVCVCVCGGGGGAMDIITDCITTAMNSEQTEFLHAIHSRLYSKTDYAT